MTSPAFTAEDPTRIQLNARTVGSDTRAWNVSIQYAVRSLNCLQNISEMILCQLHLVTKQGNCVKVNTGRKVRNAGTTCIMGREREGVKNIGEEGKGDEENEIE